MSRLLVTYIQLGMAILPIFILDMAARRKWIRPRACLAWACAYPALLSLAVAEIGFRRFRVTDLV